MPGTLDGKTIAFLATDGVEQVSSAGPGRRSARPAARPS